MANPGFLKLEGMQQAVIQSSVNSDDKEGMIQFFTFEHKLDAQAKPKEDRADAQHKHNPQKHNPHKHKPIVITKETDKFTPALYKALCSGEQIKTAKFSWFATLGSKNEEQQVYSVTIDKAKIIAIETSMPDTRETAEGHINLSEKITFAYEKITWAYDQDESTSYKDKSNMADCSN